MKDLKINFIPKENMEVIIPFLCLSNDCAIDESCTEDFKVRIAEMVAQGYLCIGVYEKQKLIGISGLWVLYKHYIGKHIEPDNVIILPEYREKGVGEVLMNWILEYAKTIGCTASEVNCYRYNEKGIQFWERMGYEKIGIHLQKILK